MLTAWVLFPVLLAALSLGWGLLLQAATGGRIPRVVVPGAGMAAIVVLGQYLTLADATAELATPAIAAGGVIGLGVGVAAGLRPPPAWAVVAGAATFAVYAAPIVLSGEATIAGFIQLDDTATWLALTDRIMEHGRSLDGLAASTYEATLDFNLGDGYPVGVFVPLGVGASLAGEDVAWVIQPYMALWAALLALALWGVSRGVLADPRARAAAAFLGAQAALLFGYYLWGGIKEVAAIALIATLAAALPRALGPGSPARTIPPALVAAALVGVLSGGGVLWLVPILAAAATVCVRGLGPAAGARRAGAFAFVAAAGALPVLVAGGALPPTSSPLTDPDAIGNLGRPLEITQLAGIWPAGDFRTDPAAPALAYSLVAVTAAGAVAGVVAAWRRRAWWAVAFVAGTACMAIAIAIAGSPWVDGKALATASVVVPFAALLGAGSLWAAGRRVAGGVLGVAVVAGVLWSNALAYTEVSLAPRDQLAELERIGDMIAGEGPTLMTEYSPYGARHFLREGDPEAVSELRRREIPLASGGSVRKGLSVDTDELAPDGLLIYRSLVLRRSPARSRPPSPYRLAWSGDDYELWQRPPGPVPPIERLPLGSRFDPTGIARCEQVRELAAEAGSGDRIVAALADRPLMARLGDDLAGAVDGRPGSYSAWLLGSVRGDARLLVDGEEAGRARHVLNNEGGWVRLGEVELTAGDSPVVVELGGTDLHPGSGGPRPAAGPVVFVPAAASTRLEVLSPAQAETLCERRLDWIEISSR